MFRLAGHLGMTVGELEKRMSSSEFAEWIAYTKHWQRLPDSWAETGTIASAILAPHCRKGRIPKAEDFVGLDPAPQHPEQIRNELDELLKRLEGR